LRFKNKAKNEYTYTACQGNKQTASSDTPENQNEKNY